MNIAKYVNIQLPELFHILFVRLIHSRILNNKPSTKTRNNAKPSLTLSITLYLLFTFSSTQAISEVYKYKDEAGNIIYSDSPPSNQPNLAPAELPPVIYHPATVPVEREKKETVSTEKLTVSISTPEQDAFILPTQQNFSVSASLSRTLQPNESITLFVNGKPNGSAGQTTSWTVENLSRGEYSLNVIVTNDQNKTIATSGATTIFVQRTIAR